MKIKRQHLAPEIISHRREAVAALRLRKLSARKIAIALQQMNPPVLKPNGKAYGKTTIISDIRALEKEWQANASRDTATHMARLLAETQEVYAAAWVKGDLNIVLKAIERQSKMLGVDAPVRREISGPGGAPIEVAAFSEEAAAELLDRFRFQPPESVVDITSHSARVPLGLTLSEEPTNGNGGAGGGHNGDAHA